MVLYVEDPLTTQSSYVTSTEAKSNFASIFIIMWVTTITIRTCRNWDSTSKAVSLISATLNSVRVLIYEYTNTARKFEVLNVLLVATFDNELDRWSTTAIQAESERNYGEAEILFCEITHTKIGSKSAAKARRSHSLYSNPPSIWKPEWDPNATRLATARALEWLSSKTTSATLTKGP